MEINTRMYKSRQCFRIPFKQAKFVRVCNTRTALIRHLIAMWQTRADGHGTVILFDSITHNWYTAPSYIPTTTTTKKRRYQHSDDGLTAGSPRWREQPADNIPRRVREFVTFVFVFFFLPSVFCRQKGNTRMVFFNFSFWLEMTSLVGRNSS